MVELIKLYYAITNNWDAILLAASSIVASASILVKLLMVIAKATKTDLDDKILAKIMKLLNAIALNPKGGSK